MSECPLLLESKGLCLSLQKHQILNRISFRMRQGETVGLVGESGSGKSLTGKAILGFVPEAKGEILFQGKNLLGLKEKQMQAIRGSQIGLVSQNPMTSLNPTLPIEKQLIEGILYHRKISKKEAVDRAADLLHKLGMSCPHQILKLYPDQLSGGMRQRIVIAMALMPSPSLLIADEPTTSLDVTTQAQILDLLQKMQQDLKMGVLLITHDLGVVAGRCHYIYILEKGAIVDEGTPEEIFYKSSNPYTQELCWKRL